MTEPTYTENYKGCVIKIYQDDEPQSPKNGETTTCF